MRALLASLLALALIAAAVAPHVHPHAARSDECVACVLGHTAPPSGAGVDVAPVVHVEGDARAAAGLAPVTGAPLGAIPGQSPPATA